MFKNYRQWTMLFTSALLAALSFTASADAATRAVPEAFNLQYPINGQIILDRTDISYFQWEEAPGATDYFIAVLEILDGNDEEVIQKTGTAAADEMPLPVKQASAASR